MRTQECQIGMKVKLLSKTVLDASPAVDSHGDVRQIHKQGWGYITKIVGDGSGQNEANCLVVDKYSDSGTGDYYRPQDLVFLEDVPGTTLKVKDCKIGTRVKVVGRSIPGFDDDSNWHRRLRETGGFIMDIHGRGRGTGYDDCIVVGQSRNHTTGNYYAPQDLELYGKKTIEKIRLLSKVRKLWV